MPVTLDVSPGRIQLWAGSELLGDWGAADMELRTTENHLVVKAEGEIMEIDVPNRYRLMEEFGSGSPAATTVTDAGASTDLAASLRSLRELRDEGALSDAEFTTAKAKLLSGGAPTGTDSRTPPLLPPQTQAQSSTGQTVAKYLLIGFNILMAVWAVGYFVSSAGSYGDCGGSGACEAGTAIGTTLGLGFIAFVWAAGSAVLYIIYRVTGKNS